jgi:iron complex outermembrane receptor protein
MPERIENQTERIMRNVKPEKNDFELGWRYVAEKVQFNTNVLYGL